MDIILKSLVVMEQLETNTVVLQIVLLEAFLKLISGSHPLLCLQRLSGHGVDLIQIPKLQEHQLYQIQVRFLYYSYH